MTSVLSGTDVLMAKAPAATLADATELLAASVARVEVVDGASSLWAERVAAAVRLRAGCDEGRCLAIPSLLSTALARGSFPRPSPGTALLVLAPLNEIEAYWLRQAGLSSGLHMFQAGGGTGAATSTEG